MSWTNYFIALGLPVFFTTFTFLLAVAFINSDFLRKTFLITFVFSIVFEMAWFFVGLAIAVVMVIGGGL